MVVIVAIVVSVAQFKGPSISPRVVVPVRFSDFQVDDLHMVSASVGWAVEGVTGDILHTAGSVESWQVVDLPGKPPPEGAAEASTVQAGRALFGPCGAHGRSRGPGRERSPR